MSLADLAASMGGLRFPGFRYKLTFPWLWPVDPTEERRLLLEGLPHPRKQELGETLLVTVTDTGARASLWWLRAGPSEREDLPWSHMARDSLHRAEGLVLRDLPTTSDPRPLLTRRPWSARSIAVRGAGCDDALDGDSVGASCLLAAASIALGRPVPTTVAASAALEADGRLKRVDGLPDKGLVLEQYGLGIERFFVHADQVEAARSKLQGRLTVVGVRSSHDLLREVFPGYDDLRSLPPAWEPEEAALAAAERLFRLAIGRGSSLLPWKLLGQLADLLVVHLGDRPAARRAAFARQVFSRHAGLRAPIPVTEACVAEGLPEPLRISVLAHVVQAAADCFEGLEAVEELAKGNFPDAVQACHPDHLRLCGALARARAHARLYEQSSALLGPVARSWLELELAGEASYSLCELARVQGILRQRDELLETERLVLATEADPATDAVSASYLDLAMGRAWVSCGDPDRALRWLDTGHLVEAVTRQDVQVTRRRWRALALDQLGRAKEAASERAGLLGMGADEIDPVDRAIVELEVATASGADPGEALEELRRLRPAMVQSLGAGVAGKALAQRLSREYPY